jgi:hypothetical protein
LKNFDMAAVSRVASRVELRGIRLVDLSVVTKKLVDFGTPLEPSFETDCVPGVAESGHINVDCNFSFFIHSKGEEVSEAKIKYLIHYRLKGEGVPSAQDVEAFAAVNGAYHAWPFVRELIFSLTSRMGFQGFTLPVLSFHNPKQNKSEPSAAQKDTDSRETRTT